MMPVIPTIDEKKPFCEVASDGPMYSNFQLYFLRQADRIWKELQNKKSELTQPQVKKRLVFVVVCAGTSITQLLGQNANHSQATRVDGPKFLFKNVFGPDHPKRREFEDFIDVYDDCRHFGSPKYASISELTEEKVETFQNLILKLWDEVVRKYKGNHPEELTEFTTVHDLMIP